MHNKKGIKLMQNSNLLIDNFNNHISLTLDEIDLINTCFKKSKIKKNEFLLKEGAVFKRATFILNGCLIMYFHDDNGKKHITQIAQSGNWVGDISSFLSGKPSAFYVESLEDCELLIIPKEHLEELYLKVPKLERYFRILIQNAYVSVQEKANSQISVPAKARYISLLESFPNIENRVPQYAIASFLGIRPEYLSRIKNKKM